MTSVVGGGGQADYCAANAYLDAFAARPHASRPARSRSPSTGTPGSDVGMAVDTAVPGDLDAEREALLEARHRARRRRRGLRAHPRPSARRRRLPCRPCRSRRSARGTVARRGPTRRQSAAPPPTRPRCSLHARPEIATDYARAGERNRAADRRGLAGAAGHRSRSAARTTSSISAAIRCCWCRRTRRSPRGWAASCRSPICFSSRPFARSPHISAAGTARRSIGAPRPVVRAAGEQASAIAIVGMAGRFPGAPDLDTFWTNLRDGVESIERLTDDQLRARGVAADLLARSALREGGEHARRRRSVRRRRSSATRRAKPS